ncbi:hypothetical protein YTPLAS72_12250 [Nitrospira sp.]|nr:hypothetical protein YTPLAS72_12250 [Nitrospira sp.]
MATDPSNPMRTRAGARSTQTKPFGVDGERRVLCRRCHSGVLTLFMCGPRLRGRCQDCGTTWVYLWSCTKQGWFPWSNS